MPSPTVATPRPAATVLLLRDAPDTGCEVLMVRRSATSGFAASAWVFPGGVVEPEDRVLPAPIYRGLDPAALAERFAGDAGDVLGFHVAGIRELYEEAGILLADGDVEASVLGRGRAQLAAGGDFAAFLAAHGLVLPLDRLVYLARWITPRRSRRRFHTAFFVARAPEGQEATHDTVETTAKRWVRPRQALDAHRDGRWGMLGPTVTALEWLEERRSSADALATAAAQPTVPWILPHPGEGDTAGSFLYPFDPGYPVADYRDELAASPRFADPRPAGAAVPRCSRRPQSPPPPAHRSTEARG